MSGPLANRCTHPTADTTSSCSSKHRPFRSDPNRGSRSNELPKFSSDNDEDRISSWAKTSRKLKRSASSASLGHADGGNSSFRNATYLLSRALHSPSADNISSYGSSDSGFRPDVDDEDTDVMIDFMPSLDVSNN